MLDLIIKNGEIVDGSGDKSFKSDIGIKDSKIQIISTDIKEESKNYIDAKGHVVSPGFIDIHSHSDFTLFINNRGESKIRQGITTEVVGNCGFTAGPIRESHLNDLLSYLANTVILSEEEKKKWRWETQADFIAGIGEKGISFNIAPLVGQGTIRVAAMGFEKRKPSANELDDMLKMLRKEMDKGLYGLSTGLQYEPGLYTTMDELIEMTNIVKSYNGVYATHMRDEGRDGLKCISESIEISQKTGVSLELSHLKASFYQNWGDSVKALKLIDDARSSGIDVDFDVYPYIAYGSGLIDLIPPWAREHGAEKMVEMLKNETTRARIINDMNRQVRGWDNPAKGLSWKDIKIATLKTDKNKKYEGKSLDEISHDMGCQPQEAVIKLLIEEEGGIKCIYFAMCDEDLETIIKHPSSIFGTDGRAMAIYGPLGKGAVHPRYYGTYPRILGRYVRDKKILSLEEAIKKMTLLPATKMKFKKRGQLKEGYYADIAIFDKDEVIDVATFEKPHNYPIGIEYVIVNGQVVISKGEHTGRLPGRVLNHRND